MALHAIALAKLGPQVSKPAHWDERHQTWKMTVNSVIPV